MLSGGESDSGEAIEIATIKLNALHQRGVPLNGLIYLLQKRMILGIFALWIIFTVGTVYCTLNSPSKLVSSDCLIKYRISLYITRGNQEECMHASQPNIWTMGE